MSETAMSVEPLDAGVGLRLAGDIDASTLAFLRGALASVDPTDDLHLDLSRLSFIDVAGARALVRRAERLEPGCQLVLHHPPYVLRRVLDAFWGGRTQIRTDVS